MIHSNRARRWLTMACAWCWLSGAALAAQPGSPSDELPPQQTPDEDVFPRVRLIYYAGVEGRGSKEAVVVNLTEWTPDKDVYLDYGWSDPAKKRPPAEGEPAERDYSLPAPRQRVWKIRYEAAGVEGKSRLFVSGLGSQSRARIYFAADYVSFIHLSDVGWYELGAEGRLARYFAQRRPQTTAPIPTRSQ